MESSPSHRGKIAILSDIHGNMGALERVVENMQERKIERVFNLGDHVSGPLYPKETLEFLKNQDWVHIAGNHDRQMARGPLEGQGLSNQYGLSVLSADDLDWLRSLPPLISVDEFLLFHGTPGDDMMYLLETVEHGRTRLASPAEIEAGLGGRTAPVLACGHTHIPRVVQPSREVLVVNPGSVGLQAYDDVTPGYHVIETGSPQARYTVMEYKDDGWQMEFIAVPYDHEQAARQASKNGRLDWEYALRTGLALRTKDK